MLDEESKSNKTRVLLLEVGAPEWGEWYAMSDVDGERVAALMKRLDAII